MIMLDEQQELRNASVISKDGEMTHYTSAEDYLEALGSYHTKVANHLVAEEMFADTFASDAEYFLKHKEQIREALAKALIEENVKANLAGKGNTKLEELLASGEIVLPSNMEFTEALRVLDNQAVHKGRFGYLDAPLPPAKGFVPTKSKKSK